MTTESTRPPARFRGLDHVGMTVPDVEAAAAYYVDLFGGQILYRMGPFDSREMPPAGAEDWTAAHIGVPDAALKFIGVRVAETLMLELYEFSRPGDRRMRPPTNADMGPHHLALRVDDVDAAAGYLAAKGCKMMSQRIIPPAGPLLGSRSWYFRDPWGNTFELMEYQSMAFMERMSGA
jgi:catechol 2,3-dioxygenase-like lactoylglutathione lyase family enzyme